MTRGRTGSAKRSPTPAAARRDRPWWSASRSPPLFCGMPLAAELEGADDCLGAAGAGVVEVVGAAGAGMPLDGLDEPPQPAITSASAAAPAASHVALGRGRAR